MRCLSGLISREKAQALVEMALVLPVLLLFFTGICEFGKIMGSYIMLSNLAREGARFGVVGHNDWEIKNRIYEQIGWLDKDNMDINIYPSPAERNSGDRLKVEIDYKSHLMTPVFASILPDPVLLTAECSMRME